MLSRSHHALISLFSLSLAVSQQELKQQYDQLVAKLTQQVQDKEQEVQAAKKHMVSSNNSVLTVLVSNNSVLTD